MLRNSRARYLTSLIPLAAVALVSLARPPRTQRQHGRGSFATLARTAPQPIAAPAEKPAEANPPASPRPPSKPAEARVAAGPSLDATRTAVQASAKPTPAIGEPEGQPTFLHTTHPGESAESIARSFLPQTTFMTVAELTAAIRQANNLNLRQRLRPGETVAIPGAITAPLVEKPHTVARDFEVRGIYLTGFMAGSQHGIELIRRWRAAGGNAVVFDIKDCDGAVNVPFHGELAPTNRPEIRNLPKFARFLHSLGLHSIARIAVFRDERLVRDHPELAVRSRRSGKPWLENGQLAWTDPSLEAVQDYNLALARTVAEAGIDEIQFDYVRFPAEGDQPDARFAFEKPHPDWSRSQVISDFAARAYAELHPLGVLVSLDVFGVMAWQRPVDLEHTGQNIRELAQHCDALSPMIYPSHFFHMDGYARPGDAPEHFISESMQRFREVTAGSNVVLRPWLQAFAWRTRTYSPAYILTQVSAAKQEDGIGFLFWNASNNYAKLFIAMSQMRARPGDFFRGDEVRSSTGSTASATLAPARQ